MNTPRLLRLTFIAGSVGLVLLGQVARAADEPKVRPPACAGSWYPGDAATLAKTVDDLLAQAKPPGGVRSKG
jgi:hypothetical protein